jgi:Lipid A disaccharide synthetase
MAETVTRAKNILKTVLGQVPLTAELYWLMRGSDKTLNSRFSLKKLDQHMAELVEQASALKTAAKAGGKKIFIFSTLHYWIEHAAVMGMALAGLGHDVTLGYLPYQDWQNPINPFDLRRQNLYAEDILGKAKAVINVVSFLSLHNGYKVVPEDLRSKIEQVSRYDSMYTLQVENVDTGSAIYKLRLKRNMSAARDAYDYLTTQKPDVVIVPNGTIQEFGVVYEVARSLGIQTITYEFGEQRERMWLAQNGKVMLQETGEMWEAFRDLPLKPDEKKTIHEQFEARRGGSLWKNFSRQWQQIPAQGVESARKQLGLDQRPVVLLATNVLGDSLTLGREVFSQSMEDWLVKSLQYFAGRPDVQLVIRVHPGEVLIHGQSMMDVIQRVLPKLPEFIHVIAPTEKVNTYDLIAAADVGLVYTTTVGLEMAMSGIPVVVVGNTHYRGRGFTQDPDTWVKYHKMLKAILEKPQDFRLTDEQVELAWAYAYRFFFNYPLPFPWHLVHLWEDYPKRPIGELVKSKEWKTYKDTFSYLAGEPLDWQNVRNKYA